MTQFTITDIDRSHNSYGGISWLQISGENVVWSKEIIQLTNNNELFEIDPRLRGKPKIDGNKVVWERNNMVDSIRSIIFATINNTKSQSVQNSDRKLKFITSSTIIILSFVFLCLLKTITSQMSND